MAPFRRLRQLRKAFSYKAADFPPMPRDAAWPQNGTIPSENTVNTVK